MKMQSLTDKEQLLLESIRQGMDEENCGWLHELDPFNNSRVCAGVLSSLMKKNLVNSYQDEDNKNCYWVSIK
jgi:DNA-binding MarR family transcriptional regulator